MNVNELIAKRRKELGLTLEEVATHVGVRKGTVKKWETGMIKNMGRDKMAKLAEILCISPTDLLDDVPINSWEEGTKKETPPAPPFPVTDHEKQMIQKYRCLPVPARAAVDVMIDSQYDLIRPRLKNEEETS